MAVYVDAILTHPSGEWCHMVADSHVELMMMARKLGLRPEWIQHPDTYLEHFDLRPATREQAIAYGAKPVSIANMGRILVAKRTGEETAPRGGGS